MSRGHGRAPLLYGPNGRVLVPRARAVAYDAAGSGRRASNWFPTTDAINAIVEGSVDTLRARSRDMVRRNPYAATARERYVSNIVGTGVVPVPKTKDKDFRSALRELWDEFVDECDADGISDFYGQQALVMGGTFEAGETFARFRPRRAEDGLAVPLQIQLLESDFLRSTMNENLASGNRIRQGIEFNGLGRRVAYHFYRDHPGDRFSLGGIQTTRVPADDVMQVFEPLRPGQLRGLPRTAPILAKLYELDQFDDAQLVRQKIAAMFAFFFTKQQDPAFGGTDDIDGRSQIDSIEPGTGYELLPGEDVRFPDPPQVGNYTDFVRAQLRAIAGPLDLTAEQLTGDLAQVNYSSIRAGLLEIRRRHEQIQHGVLCFQFNRRVWRRFVVDAVISGAIDAPADFVAAQRRYTAAKWIPQGWQWVDPEKEIKAIVLAIRSGLLTRSMAVAQYGYDAEEIDREMAEDNARADEFGLIYESDGRQATNQQLAEPAAPEEQPVASNSGGANAAAAA